LPIREAFERCVKGKTEPDWVCVETVFEAASQEALQEDHFRIHQWAAENWKRKPKEYSRFFLEHSHDLIVDILTEEYEFEHKTPIHIAPRRGSERFPLLTDDQILSWLNPVYRKLSEIRKVPETFLVGRAANYGATWEDIDILYRDNKLEWFEEALLKAIPEEHRDRVEFIPNPAGALVGHAIPLLSEFQYPVFEGEEETLKEKLKRFAKQKEVKPGRFVLQMKTVLKGINKIEDLEKERLAEIWDEAFTDGEMLEIGVEKKFGGAFIQLHKKGDKVWLFTRTGRNQAGIPLKLTESAKKLPAKEIVLNGEFVAYDERGHPLFYGVLAKTIHGEKPFDDSYWKFHVYDLLYYTGRDLHDEDYSVRRGLLEKIKLTGNIELSPIKKTRNPASIQDLVKWAAALKGSEGAMLKIMEGVSSKYRLDGKTRGILKFKQFFDIDARVVKRIPKREAKTGKIIPGQWQYVCEIGSKREGYSIIGTTFSTDIKAEPGDILRVDVQIIRRYNEKDYHWIIPKVVEIREDLTEPDSYAEAERIRKLTAWRVTPKTEMELAKVKFEKEGLTIKIEHEPQIIQMPEMPKIEFKPEMPKIELKPEIKVEAAEPPKIDVNVEPAEVRLIMTHPKRRKRTRVVKIEGKGKEKRQVEEEIEEVIE